MFGAAYASVASTVCRPARRSRSSSDRFVAGRTFASFGVRVRRVDKALPFRSQELAVELGARVQAATGAAVDLETPRALDRAAPPCTARRCCSHERLAWPGGLPVRSAGRALALLSGGIDSPAAAWLLMKRGCLTSFAHFHSAPYTSVASQRKARATRWRTRPAGRADAALAGAVRRAAADLVREAPAEPRIVLYRRFMLRIAQARWPSATRPARW